MGDAARREDVAVQKMPGEPKGRVEFGLVGKRGEVAALQKGGIAQQSLAPGLSRLARDRATGFRRDIGEILARAGQRAGAEIKAKAQRAQHRDLEPRQQRRRVIPGAEPIRDQPRHLMDFGVRIALGQQPQQRAEESHAVQGVSVFDQPRRARLQRLDEIGPKLAVEPRPPIGDNLIARLKHGAQRASLAAAHQAEVAPMLRWSSIRE